MPAKFYLIKFTESKIFYVSPIDHTIELKINKSYLNIKNKTFEILLVCRIHCTVHTAMK